MSILNAPAFAESPSLEGCIQAVVHATPKPSRYEANTADTTTLFNLCIVDEDTHEILLEAVKHYMKPYHINEGKIDYPGVHVIDPTSYCASGSTVLECATAVQAAAY